MWPCRRTSVAYRNLVVEKETIFSLCTLTYGLHSVIFFCTEYITVFCDSCRTITLFALTDTKPSRHRIVYSYLVCCTHTGYVYTGMQCECV